MDVAIEDMSREASRVRGCQSSKVCGDLEDLNPKNLDGFKDYRCLSGDGSSKKGSLEGGWLRSMTEQPAERATGGWNLFVFFAVDLFECLCVYLSIFLFFWLLFDQAIYLCVLLFLYQPVCLSI